LFAVIVSQTGGGDGGGAKVGSGPGSENGVNRPSVATVCSIAASNVRTADKPGTVLTPLAVGLHNLQANA